MEQLLELVRPDIVASTSIWSSELITGFDTEKTIVAFADE
jgi:hypothetical protein